MNFVAGPLAVVASCDGFTLVLVKNAHVKRTYGSHISRSTYKTHIYVCTYETHINGDPIDYELSVKESQIGSANADTRRP